MEEHERIRHLKAGEPIETLEQLIEAMRPELLFIFDHGTSEQCRLIRPRNPVQIVTLDGKDFLHPAPVVLEGLRALKAQRGQWSPGAAQTKPPKR